VVVESGDVFLGACAEDLLPFLDKGFSAGHLAISVEKLDRRTRFAKAAAGKAWIVECAQPYDRPPPWDTRTPVWQSDLSRWVAAHARTKGLEMDLESAFALHARAGTDLAVLDEELEKIATYLAGKAAAASPAGPAAPTSAREPARRTVDEAIIAEVVGDLHEDTVFLAIDLFLECRRADALAALKRLLERGVHTDRGAPSFDPMNIALLFIGAVLPRLRALRRAHALAARGEGPERWIAAGLVQKAFLVRFERQMRACPPPRIAKILQALYEFDKTIKGGGDAARLLELLFVDCT
jgi:DNA polymerase III delta subunit